VIVALLAAACDTDDGRQLDDPTEPLPAPPVPASTLPPEPTQPAALQLFMPWPDAADVPVRHTCEGEDIAPAMSWTDVPAGTVELAVTVTDLDAAGFVHWIVYGIPPDVTSLREGSLPDGVFEWPNSFGSSGYGGPCPPAGELHLYQFTVHALNQQLEAADDAPATEVISILNQIAIDQSSVAGAFVRSE
jgi:Raf kinase inhibitor-like YbhB/YbcL family protein